MAIISPDDGTVSRISANPILNMPVHHKVLHASPFRKKITGLFSFSQFVALCLFVLLFSAENFLAVFIPQQDKVHYLFSSGFLIRFIGINVLGILFLYLLPRFFSYFLISLNTVFDIFILSWHRFLGDTPSVTAVRTSLENHLARGLNLFAYIDWPSFFILFFLLALNICLLHRATPPAWKNYRKTRLAGLFLIALFFTAAAHVALSRHGLDLTRLRKPVAENVLHRGYTATWFAEAVHPLKTEEEFTCSPARQAIAVFPGSDKVVYIQVESLGYSLIGRRSNGHTVMPFLTDMVDNGLMIRVDGTKKLTSQNSDYELLNTRVAEPDTVYYRTLKSYPDSIPLQFKRRGADLHLFHGLYDVAGMRKAYPLMGFDKLTLQEELLEAGHSLNQATPSHIDDRDLFAYASKQVPADKPFFHVIITMNMHDPAKQNLNPRFDGDSNRAFFTNARITDEGIRDYVSVLPQGVTVIVMGDHSPYFGPASSYTPLIFFKTGEPTHMKTPETVLTRCEASHYLRRVFHLPPALSNRTFEQKKTR